MRPAGALGRCHREERGAAVVELAFVLPLLLVMLLGMLDFGKAYNYWVDETHLANEAARWAMVGKSPDGGSSIETAIQNQANSGELRDGGGSVKTKLAVTFCFPSGSTGLVGQPIQADAKATYSWLGYISKQVKIAPTTPIVGKAVMRLEQPYKAGTSPYTASACP